MAWIRVAIVAAFGALATASAVPAQADGAKAVIELFTSQGCSSCPAADRLLADYAGRNDVLALSYNVDYWDYLGWKDTLASHDFSQRQRDYSAARGDGDVYTPQAIIDGRNHVPGSLRGDIEGAIAANQGGLSVPIDMTVHGDAVTVNVGASPSDVPHATLWLVMYDRAVTVPIGRGENSGKTITYTNVVRKMRPIAMWTGAAMSVDLAKSEMEHAKADSCAVLLQTESKDGLPGPILGAATVRAGL
ncbi:MAG TPA: DUF1223 domain-containing protein [Bauldia sp.]|nr:DUF1223 domain-containing protein [Bauldia sp.]